MVKCVDDFITDEMSFGSPNVRVSRRPNGTLLVEHINSEKSMTQQCFSDAADVNKIMARWLNGGPPPVSSAARGVFKDVSHGLDYREVLERVAAVTESFDSLPADMRGRFKNDPAMLLDFVSDPANIDECVKLGLVEADVSEVSSVSEQSPLDVTVRTDTASVS